MVHGHARRVNGKPAASRLYRIWHGMMMRCFNERRKDFRYYGARGIKVCRAWRRPERFIFWAAANGYSDALTIDRVDRRRGYSPANCRWVTRSENSSRRADPRPGMAVAA